MRDMMNYHCLRVLRSHVRRIGKQSPGFSEFRTRERGCSDAELCSVPIQSTVVVIFVLGIIHFPTISSGGIDKERKKKKEKKKKKRKTNKQTNKQHYYQYKEPLVSKAKLDKNKNKQTNKQQQQQKTPPKPKHFLHGST